jgi:hypothetical protein
MVMTKLTVALLFLILWVAIRPVFLNVLQVIRG